jgi:septal ring factor EnvC (AmiA/AmiB activator)
MSQPNRTRSSILLIILNLFFCATVFSANNAIKQQILSVSSKLSADKKKQAELTNELKNTEKSMGNITIKTSKLSTTIQSQSAKIKALEKQRDEDQAKLKGQQATLAKLIRANYLLQRQGKVGIVASGYSADETLRYLHYYQALDNRLLQAIQAQQQTIAHLSEILANIQQRNAALNQSFTELTQEKKTLLKEQNTRKTILDSLNTAIETNEDKLEKLKSDQQALKKIVSVATPTKATHLVAQTSPKNLSFQQQRGKLPFPTNGRLESLFAIPMSNTSGYRQGDLFNSPMDTEVRSVYAGKVIYADWLRGYGLLMIIDHGNGYMTLYGRNHALYRQVGDTVNAGDKIATLGESGGFTSPALYFEIRHDGTALNPKQWLIA